MKTLDKRLGDLEKRVPRPDVADWEGPPMSEDDCLQVVLILAETGVLDQTWPHSGAEDLALCTELRELLGTAIRRRREAGLPDPPEEARLIEAIGDLLL